MIYDRQRIPDGRAFTASPWAYDGKIFCLNEDGVTFVMQAGDQFAAAARKSTWPKTICAWHSPADRRLVLVDSYGGEAVLLS